VGKEVKMRYIKFLLISTLIAILLIANPLPVFVINELYLDSEDNWQLELESFLPEEKFEGHYLKSKSDTASFLPGLEFNGSGFLLLNNSSMVHSLDIDKNGDSIEIINIEYGDIYALYFGPGEKYKAPDSGQSLCRDQYADGEFYLDNSPTLGFENDTLNACCTISGYVKDSLDNPIDSVKLCLNKYLWGYSIPTCRSTTYTNTDGSFELRSLAFAFLSTLEFTKNQYDTTEIDSLDISPDSTYDLGIITLKMNQGALPEDRPEFNQFSLSQNYPNPFIRETKIVFTLPAELPTLLEIYDTKGQKVKTLAKGIIAKGRHEISLDAADLSSGVYIYKLRAGRQYSDSKKLILTK
jgi:hypothetical protein